MTKPQLDLRWIHHCWDASCCNWMGTKMLMQFQKTNIASNFWKKESMKVLVAVLCCGLTLCVGVRTWNKIMFPISCAVPVRVRGWCWLSEAMSATRTAQNKFLWQRYRRFGRQDCTSTKWMSWSVLIPPNQYDEKSITTVASGLDARSSAKPNLILWFLMRSR